MMKAVRAAAPRPVPSGRAGIEPAKTGGKPSFLRLSIVHFSFDAAVRGDGAPHSCPPLQGKGLRASRRGLRSGEGFHLRLHRASHPPICRAIDIWPDDWAASLWAPP